MDDANKTRDLSIKKREKKKSSKMRRLGVSLTLLILAAWLIWGNFWIKTSHYKVTNQKIPKEFSGFTLAQISDLHNKEWGDSLLKRLKTEAPDLIVITGDLIDSNHMDLAIALKFAQEAVGIAPVYFITGNHEAWSGHYSELKQGLIDFGVKVLENEKVRIEKDGKTLTLMGLMDPAFMPEARFSYEKEAAMANNLSVIMADQDGFKILLSHRPESFAVYVEAEIDLVLSGHAHGGQVRIPFIGGLVAPDQGFFPDFTKGPYKEANTTMIVSRGLGNSIIPLRVNNNPELVIIRLENERLSE